MSNIPSVGGSELIEIMKQLGFRVTSSGAGLSTMRRELDAVVVPEQATLNPALVGSILCAAHVEAVDFLRAVDVERAIASAEQRYLGKSRG